MIKPAQNTFHDGYKGDARDGAGTFEKPMQPGPASAGGLSDLAEGLEHAPRSEANLDSRASIEADDCKRWLAHLPTFVLVNFAAIAEWGTSSK